MLMFRNCFVVGICCCLFFAACIYDPGDKRLVIINKSNNNICVSWNKEPFPEYPSKNKTEFYFSNIIAINREVKLPETDANWPYFVQTSSNKKLNLFVFNVDSLKYYNSIDTLIKRKIYKYFKFSEEELEKQDWKVQVSN